MAAVAPGTALRDGLERILRGRTGALIVLGWNREIEAICNGGFTLNTEFSAARLRELAKMDGAVVLDNGATIIRRAAVHLAPDTAGSADESGTRHRTAQLVSQQTGFPVVTVSRSMSIISIFIDGVRHVLEPPEQVLAKANQALATLERYRHRLDEVATAMSALEVEDLVTVRDVALLVQRSEMLRRITDEIAGYATELGDDGRLVTLQMDDLDAGVGSQYLLVLADYLPNGHSQDDIVAVNARLHRLESQQLLDLSAILSCLGLAAHGGNLDSAITTRGIRQLHKIPRLPNLIIHRLVNRFGTLPRMLAADQEQLMRVEGVGEHRAQLIREGLTRLTESSVLEH
ncbi:MAG: DNA integrity scanning protein DisA [Micrococcales bacterium]|nr:MAG: DNA integrity scanning protein DisA [Micrococcales bacterium]